MLKNWNFYAGIRKLSLEKFIKTCNTVNDIKFKLDTLNIIHNSFPWSEAEPILLSRNIIVHKEQDENGEDDEIIQVTVAVPKQKKKNKKIELSTSKDD